MWPTQRQSSSRRPPTAGRARFAVRRARSTKHRRQHRARPRPRERPHLDVRGQKHEAGRRTSARSATAAGRLRLAVLRRPAVHRVRSRGCAVATRRPLARQSQEAPEVARAAAAPQPARADQTADAGEASSHAMCATTHRLLPVRSLCGPLIAGVEDDAQRRQTTTASIPGPVCAPTTAPSSLVMMSSMCGSRLSSASATWPARASASR